MILKLVLIISWCIEFQRFFVETYSYISTERPVIEYFNPIYVNNFTTTSRRINRKDPRYYIDFFADTNFTIDEHTSISVYFNQFLTNRYRPSFIEMHFNFCELIKDNKFLGSPIRIALNNQTCPFPPGKYYLRNINLLPVVPPGFPFSKGRILANGTFSDGKVNVTLAYGYIDIEVKTTKIKSNL